MANGYTGDMNLDRHTRERRALDRKQAAAQIYAKFLHTLRDIDGNTAITELRDMDDTHGQERLDKYAAHTEELEYLHKAGHPVDDNANQPPTQ
ncbi:MAG: hypothetical protein HY365_03140 [Candidatus Aenigmarchaeota archaeon]|nr:hypothetical protein [Candidatus Aenigmarchaeota archaeon]